MPRRYRTPGIFYNRRLLGYDKVYFTRHALDRMKQRGINREDVYHAIEKPDVTGLPTGTGRHRVRWNKTDRHGVDVVYELRDDLLRVVTTIKITLGAERGKAPRILRVKEKPAKRKPRQRKPQRRGKVK